MISEKNCHLLCLLVCLTTLFSTSLGNEAQTFLKNYFKKLDEMDSDIEPEDSPIVVQTSMSIIDIANVDDRNMEFEMWFYFRQYWNDSRLRYDDSIVKSIDQKTVFNIWSPDTYITNAREGQILSDMSYNTNVRIGPTGLVSYGLRMSSKIYCPMNLKWYPHDTQICVTEIGSLGFLRDRIEMEWLDEVSALTGDPITLQDFELADVEKGHVSGEYYKALTVTLTFKRKIGFFLTKLYMPLIFLVLMANLSFWISSKNYTRLVLLLVILYLKSSVVYQMNSIAPPTSYLKAVDIWICVCQIFIFSAFFEFYLVYLAQSDTEEGAANNLPSASDIELKEQGANNSSSKSPLRKLMAAFDSNRNKENCKAHRYDVLARLLFPILFIIFNIIYWVVIYTA